MSLEKRIDTLIEKSAKWAEVDKPGVWRKVKRSLIYITAGYLLPGDKQQEFCDYANTYYKKSIKPTTMSAWSISYGITSTAAETACIFGASSLPFAASAITGLGAAFAVGLFGYTLFRLGYIIAKKKPIGGFYTEVPYQIYKAISKHVKKKNECKKSKKGLLYKTLNYIHMRREKKKAAYLATKKLSEYDTAGAQKLTIADSVQHYITRADINSI